MDAMEKVFIAAGLVITLASIFLLALSRKQRDTLLSYLNVKDRGRRSSSSTTPPRSFSPDKKLPANVPATGEYKDAFPPSTRETLPRAAASLPLHRQQKLTGALVDQAEFKKSLIPFAADFRECGPSTYTPMEVSMDEIRALGDFPDYAALSGVPLPKSYTEFVIEKALPRPYRPFRWAYHQTMSLTKLETDWWLELEQGYKARIAQRMSLFEQHSKLVLDYLPGTELACKELMEMSLQFLCARYPQYFSLTHDDDGAHHVLHNAILGTQTDVASMHPLHVLLRNVPEDFAVMLRNPADGLYYFRGGLLCSALGWNVNTKLGMVLKEIHSPIPDYKEKMEFSMDRYFSKLHPSRPIQRGSWGLEVDTPLFMPPNDPHELYRTRQDSTLPLSRLHLRVDWQTLRRLPLSGAIIFNFKAVFTPIEAFRDEKHIPALLERILKQGKKEMMEYKNTWHVEHKVLPVLEEWAVEQGDVRLKEGKYGDGEDKKGEREEVWEVRTLEESPWFEGWEEKWHREQGF